MAKNDFYSDLRKLLPRNGRSDVTDKSSIQELENVFLRYFPNERLEPKIVRYYLVPRPEHTADMCIQMEKKNGSDFFLDKKDLEDFKNGSIAVLNRISDSRINFPNDHLIFDFWNKVLVTRNSSLLTNREILFLDQWFSSIYAQRLLTKSANGMLHISIEAAKTVRRKNPCVYWENYCVPDNMGKESIFGYIYSTNRLPFPKGVENSGLKKDLANEKSRVRS